MLQSYAVGAHLAIPLIINDNLDSSMAQIMQVSVNVSKSGPTSEEMRLTSRDYASKMMRLSRRIWYGGGKHFVTD